MAKVDEGREGKPKTQGNGHIDNCVRTILDTPKVQVLNIFVCLFFSDMLVCFDVLEKRYKC